MTVNLALEYIPKRMAELGHGQHYHIRFRHFKLQPAEQFTIQAQGQLFYLIEPPNDVRIESDMGVFDFSEFFVNELQYEHEGAIIITNQLVLHNHLRLIQVIPENPKANAGK